jgi:phage terminase small subunit
MAYRPLSKLTERHELFCLHYVARPYNAAAAYVAAGFSAGGARQSAHQMLKQPLIKARIKELLDEKYKALHMDVDEILARAALVARAADVRVLLSEKGGVLTVDDLANLDDVAAAAIASIELEETKEGRGAKAKVVSRVKKVRLRDPMPAIRLLAEHRKLVKSDDAGVNALASALADRLKAAREKRKAKTST